jgi:chemotaxis protein MotA
LLWQPNEVIIIGGAGVFTVLIGNPIYQIKMVIAALITALKGTGISKATYVDLLGLMASVFDTMRKEGVLGIEADLSDPHKSARFNKFPKASHNHHLMESFTGALRLFVDGVVSAFDLERLLDAEMETDHAEHSIPSGVVSKTADAFPALGIVAAVLGIIITMQYLDQPPQVIGGKVGAALVGTMLGVLLSYGIVGPIAGKIDADVREHSGVVKCMKAGLVSFAGGAPPQVALEFARKSIPPSMRPTGAELEEIIKAAKK